MSRQSGSPVMHDACEDYTFDWTSHNKACRYYKQLEMVVLWRDQIAVGGVVLELRDEARTHRRGVRAPGRQPPEERPKLRVGL